ncbi:MAG: protein translocase subunit SecD [Bradymonadia bacterium]|jgi:preprotein translocase subunit SecD
MNRQWKTKVVGTVAVTLLAVLMLVPSFVGLSSQVDDPSALPKWYTDIFSRKLVLGLDLQGGIHLQYKVDVPEAFARKSAATATALETALAAEPYKLTGIDALPGKPTDVDTATTLVVNFASADDAKRLDQKALDQAASDYTISSVSGSTVTLKMSTAAIDQFRADAVAKAIETIERRINEFGVAESSVTRRGEDQLVVQLPGVKESEFAAAKEKLSQTGQLRFQIVDQTTGGEFIQKLAARIPSEANWPADLNADLKKHKTLNLGWTVRSTSKELLAYLAKDQVPDTHMVGFEEVWVNPRDKDLEPLENLTPEQEQVLAKQKPGLDASITKAFQIYYMFRKDGISGENVTSASVGYSQFNQPEVYMQFDQRDADAFYEMTKKFTKQQMAIMIDDHVYSAPRINEPIPGGRVRITLGSFGNQAMKEANALVAVLRSGALNAPLRKLYDSQIGPTLGADSIKDGQNSTIIGFLAVCGFMIMYYRLAGLVANVALLFNVVFTLALMAAFGATLTLPGIAGIVLTVGMAVDSNVLIFERMREELRNGVGVRKAIDLGYEKALSSIVDANLTTVIAGLVLYQFGSGPVRGFAVTLVMGILTSMFTALVITRLIFEWQYNRGAEPTTMSV